ncbi:MAG: ATP-binding protein [Pyrinomonadaceae bacterium]
MKLIDKLDGNSDTFNQVNSILKSGTTAFEMSYRPSHCDHLVQFYETETFLLDSLQSYVASGLEAGETVVLAATASHLAALESRLQNRGIAVAAAIAAGRYIELNAETTLNFLIADGALSAERFNHVIGGAVSAAKKAGTHIRVFGELVAVLWGLGEFSLALELESFWNDLKKENEFSLLCAYPLQEFSSESSSGLLSEVCATHTRVIPAESYLSLRDEQQQLRAIVLLQQKAFALQAEIKEREKAEQNLRAVTEELEMQVADLRHLHEMSLSLTSTLNVDAVLKQVLAAAVTVQKTDMGLLSLANPAGDGINVKCSIGFDKQFLKQIEFVPAGMGACGGCYKQKEPIVIKDVETDPRFEPYRDAIRKGGVRACHSTPLITRSGKIIGVLSVHFREEHEPTEREMRLMDLYAQLASDIIENARLHHQLQQELENSERALRREQIARADAEHANRMKDEFLATVSHELRTPLNAIIGWSHMLRSGRLDDDTAARAIETIERNAKSQAQLVEDVLDVSRMITGKLRLKLGLVDVAAVINAAVDSVQFAADSKQIDLEVTLEPSARHVLGDASRLQQIVWNLLSNAIKFTAAGGRVTVRLEHQNGSVQIKVTDTGQGISPEFLPCVFERFRQADASSTRRHGGLGLGLAIVRHLAELHGGTVSAASAGEGWGATFTVSLPAAIEAPGPTPRRKTTGQLPEAESLPLSVAPSLDGIKVLVVDDDSDTLQMLAIMLDEHCAQVQSASSADQAFEMLSWFKPHVVVLDLAMPGEDGYSLIEKIRRLNLAVANVPAIALTAHVRVEDRARALSAGFNMFVPKPVELTELMTAISNLAEADGSRIM